MKRKDYWMYVGLMFLGVFTLSFLGGVAGAPDGWYLLIQFASLIYMWVIGSDRMDDTNHSNAWALFAPTLIGMIIIGCLKSKEAVNE